MSVIPTNEFLPACLPAFGGLWGGKRLVLALAMKQSPQNFFQFFLEGARNFFQLRNEILRALAAVRRRAAGMGIPRAPHQSKARCGINSASGNLPFFSQIFDKVGSSGVINILARYGNRTRISTLGRLHITTILTSHKISAE